MRAASAFIAFLVAALVVASAPPGGAAPALADLQLRIKASDSPLQAVLEQVGRQSGRQVVTGGVLDAKVTVNVNGVRFGTAIRLLARPTGLVMVAEGNRLLATVPKTDLKLLRHEPADAALSTRLAPVYAALLKPEAQRYGTAYPTATLSDALRKVVLLRTLQLAQAKDVAAVAKRRQIWGRPSLFPGLLDEPLFSAYLASNKLAEAQTLAKNADLRREFWAQEIRDHLAAWSKAAALAPAVRLYVSLARRHDEAEQDLGWELYATVVTAGEVELARSLRREGRLNGQRWVVPFQQRLAGWTRDDQLPRVVKAVTAVTKGRELTPAEATFIAELGQALLPTDSGAAEDLLTGRLDGAVWTPAVYQLGAKLIASRLREGRRENAGALWRAWYRPAEVSSYLAKLARDSHGPQPAFAAYRQLISTATGLGEGAAVKDLRAAFFRTRRDTPRVVKVLPVVDTRILIRPGWRKVMDQRLQFVSDQYQRQFGIRLQVLAYHSWVPDDSGGPLGAIRQLQRSVKRNAVDLVIGFITHVFPDTPEGRRQASGGQILGMGAPEFHGYMIVRDIVLSRKEGVTVFKPGIINETFVHELGHIFGAMHVDDRSSVMRQGFDKSGPAYHFDLLNTRIVQRCKWMDLGDGFTSLEDSDLQDLATSYALLHSRYSGKEGNGADLREAQVRLILGEREAAQGKKAEARAQFRSVITLDVDKRLSAQARSSLTRLGGE